MKAASCPELEEEAVTIPLGRRVMHGSLDQPPASQGVIVMAHDVGSCRHSPRQRAVAEALHAAGLATLRVDLLTPEEAATATASRFEELDKLAAAVAAAIDWLTADPGLGALPLGLFGAGCGTAAVLAAAAARESRVAGVVCRGGRAERAAEALEYVHAPTLIIMGGLDPEGIELNASILSRLACEARLEVIPGVGAAFVESGAIERVGELTTAWLARFVAGASADPAPVRLPERWPGIARTH
jgi:putative phosphoribosyl transferase